MGNIRLFIIIILFVIVLCDAKITIKINAASNLDDAKVTFSGEDNKLVTDEEINLFNLTKDNINRGMRVELGKIPDDVFLKDPTPYDNLFKFFKWAEVKRNLHINDAKIIEIINENITLKLSEDTNNTTETIKSKINVLENIENTIFSSWSEYGLPEDEIIYDINVNFGNMGYEYQNKWRNDTIRGIYLPFGVSTEGYINLKSGQTITNKLTALKTILLIEINYSAKLIGNIIADYDRLYGKYHFYAPTVENIMRAANLTNEILTTEMLELRCYTDPKLKIFDKATGRREKIATPMKPFRRRKKVKKLSSVHTSTISVIKIK